MNKLELMVALSKENGIKKSETRTIADIFFNEMADASFYVKKYKSYIGRNPKTGKKVKISPKKLPYFKCGKELKERVDY